MTVARISCDFFVIIGRVSLRIVKRVYVLNNNTEFIIRVLIHGAVTAGKLFAWKKRNLHRETDWNAVKSKSHNVLRVSLTCICCMCTRNMCAVFSKSDTDSRTFSLTITYRFICIYLKQKTKTNLCLDDRSAYNVDLYSTVWACAVHEKYAIIIFLSVTVFSDTVRHARRWEL